jgi:predicted DNA-binding transcriptional regulator YafY
VRSDRLLSILLLLQARGRQTARELAERLEVSERTIQRDLDALSAAGIPVYSERGRHGGAALLPGFRTDVSGLTPAEARALFLFGGRGALGEPSLERDLQAALRKLMAALPEPSRPDAIRAQERVVVDSRGWRRPAEDVSHLATVQEAVWKDRRLRMSYRAAGRGAAREQFVDPWGVVVKAGVWYLVAAVGGEPRLYRVSRVEEAEVLEEASRRPSRLDLEAVWRELRQRVEEPGAAVPVELRVRAELVDMLLRIGAAQLVAPAERSAGPDASGWSGLRLRFVAEGAARSVLLGFGDGVEVLSPRSLRRSMAETAKAVVSLYEPAGTPGAGPASASAVDTL